MVDYSQVRQCKECKSISRLRWDASNPEKIVAINRRRYIKNKDKIDAKNKAAYYAFAKSESNRKILNLRVSAWKRANPDKHAACHNRRRAAKLLRLPKWLSNDQILEIQSIYTLAKDLSWLTNGGFHVDHIVPLQGKNVSGLHVPWNLQIIPALDNMKKNNKFGGLSWAS